MGRRTAKARKTGPRPHKATKDTPRPGPIARWMSRHRNPVSFWLHMVGIPACFVAAPLLLVFGRYFQAGAFFAAGYALQFIGHAVEGNQSGEGLLVRRLLGREGRV